MIQQVAFKLKPQSRGFHLITDEVLRNLPQLPKKGLLNLFVQHTSCTLSICELTEQRAQSQARLSFAESRRKKAIANYDVEAVKQLFPVEGYEDVAIVPIGHIAPDCPHPEKKRKESNDIFTNV